MNYYNEFDPKAAEWLRELIRGGHIPAGDVDERSIVEVRPADLVGYAQCHFFAGIGGWSLALHLAGWPDDRPVWTGSCPCQPFSCAGKQMGRADPRHLWPSFRRLINRCQPPVVIGEQVASAAGRLWLAGVRANLETMGYAVRASDLCSAGVGSPNIRQRLYWMANAFEQRRSEGQGQSGEIQSTRGREPESSEHRSIDRGLAGTDGRESGDGGLQPSGQHGQQPEDDGFSGMGNAEGDRSEVRAHLHAGMPRERLSEGCNSSRLGQSDCVGSPSRLSGPLAGQEGHAGVVDDSGDLERTRERERQRETNYPAGPRPQAGTGRTLRA